MYKIPTVFYTVLYDFRSIITISPEGNPKQVLIAGLRVRREVQQRKN